MAEREYYTPAGFEAMKQRLAIAAIEKSITRTAYDAVGASAILTRTADNGYEFSLDHGTGVDPEMLPPQDRAKLIMYVWPPIGPEHAGPRQTMRDLNGEWLPEQTDVWAEHYQPWFERVNEAFEGWDQLPDERDFHDAARNLEGAAELMQLDPKALPALSGNDNVVALLGALDATFGDLQGRTVSAFRANYQGKLDALISQQYWLAQILTAKLRATGDMWRDARQSVMEIGHKAAESMGEPFGRYDPEARPVSARATLTAIGKFAEIVSFLQIPYVSTTAGVAADGVQIYDKLDPPPPPAPLDQIFDGSTPENVMGNVYNALARLNRQIVDEENAVGTWARGIHDETFAPSTPKRVGFNLGPPQLITDSSSEHIQDDLQIVPGWMRFGGRMLSSGVTGDEKVVVDAPLSGRQPIEGMGLADHLDLAAVNLPTAAPPGTAWQRPAHRRERHRRSRRLDRPPEPARGPSERHLGGAHGRR